MDVTPQPKIESLLCLVGARDMRGCQFPSLANMPHQKKLTHNNFSDLDVAPSDFNQAVIRVSVVSGLLLWSILQTNISGFLELLNHNFILLTISYWFFSVLFLVWCRALNANEAVTSSKYRIRRVVGVVADLSAISAYTAIAGTKGLILYPIYLTTIIGYGYRFGSTYLYLSIACGLIGFTVALTVNRTFADPSLVIAYYIGLILVPLYSLLLLKRHEKVLQRLKQVNASRARFIANMSHELRTPLHAIISMNHVLKEDYCLEDNSSRLANEKFNMVSDSAEHLLKLVNRVLDIASSDANSDQPFRKSKTNLYGSLRRAFSISTTTAFEKGVLPHLYISSRTPEIIETSQTHLEEILVNIIGNAVKYTERGYIYVHVDSEEISDTNLNTLTIRVIDSGAGIPERLLPTIFEPFTIGDDTAARKHYGTGLGLTITKQYIEALGGTIDISSVSGSGTCVTVSIPLMCPEDNATVVENNLSCILVTPSEISPAERMLFENEGMNVGTVDIASAERLSKNQDTVDILFIDGRYLSDINFTKISQQFSAPLVLYSQTEPQVVGIGDEPNIFRSSARPGVAEDLSAVGRILRRKEKPVARVSNKAEQKFRILLADDNEINLRTAQLALESVGHSIDTVNDGEIALQRLHEQDYHLVIMDMHMPGMNGIDAAQLHNFESEKPTPIILLTADATEEARKSAEEAMVTAFLTKPIRPDELRQAVQQYARKDDYTMDRPIGKRILPHKRTIDSNAVITRDYVNAMQFDELLECGAKRDDFVELIDMFREDGLICINSAAVGLKKGELSLVQEKMHSLKGASATVGAYRLQDAAAVLEKSTYATLESSGSDIDSLREMLARSVSELEEIHAGYFNDESISS